MSLHIGYLVQQYTPEVGAGPARVSEMAARWQQQGARVTVVTAMPNRPQGRIHPDYRGKMLVREQIDGIDVFRSWVYASPRPGFSRTITNNLSFMMMSAFDLAVRVPRFDVLVASSPPYFPHFVGVAAARLRRIPLVLEIRDLWPDYIAEMGLLRPLPQRALFATERAMLRRADAVVTVTESFRKRVISKGAAAERVVSIPNGVDATSYYRSSEPPPIPEMQRRGNELIAGYLGNFGASQDLSSVVAAAKLLQERGANVRVVIAGDGPERARIEAAAQRLEAHNVSIHQPIAKNLTRSFYNNCDVCLVPLAAFPVLQETIPSKIFEVMACETPVMASVGGEAATIVERSGGGVVAKPGDAEAIADGILRVAALSDAERRTMGAAGRAYVRAHFDRTDLADKFLSVLQSLKR